jgi:hypothetical protein
MPAHFSYLRDGHWPSVIGHRSSVIGIWKGVVSNVTLTQAAIPNRRWMRIVDVTGRGMAIPIITPYARFHFFGCSHGKLSRVVAAAIGFVRRFHESACPSSSLTAHCVLSWRLASFGVISCLLAGCHN